MSKETSVLANTSRKSVYCAEAGREFLEPVQMYNSKVTSVSKDESAEYPAVMYIGLLAPTKLSGDTMGIRIYF